MRAAKDNSIYSFRLDPAAHNNVTNNKSEYDGMIHRRSFPRDPYFDDYSDSNSSYFNKNQCCWFASLFKPILSVKVIL